MNIREKYCPAHINRLEPYIPGFQPAAADRILKLNSNENAYPPSPRVKDALLQAIDDQLRLYPNATASGLRTRLAQIYGLKPENVFTGNGADEIITTIFRTFTQAGDRVVFSYPTYTYYASSAQIHNISYQFCDTDADFRIDPGDYLETESKIVFIANPNAHTGLLLEPGEIRQLLQSYPGLVVVDETYVDFAGPDCSVYQMIEEYDNLVVLRTFSKAFSLCGIRVGYAFAHPQLIEALDMTRDSYNIAYLNQVAAIAALDDIEYMRANARRICETRQWFSQELEQMGFTVLPSRGNFVFARHPTFTASSLYQGLLAQGILVRYFDARRMNEYLRISIGTREQMERVAEAVRSLLSHS